MAHPADELTSIIDYIRWANTQFYNADIFFGHGNDNAWDEAVALVFGYLRLPYEQSENVLEAKLLASERAALAQLIEQRITQHIPVAYLVGEAWFNGDRYLIEPGIVIPRSPIGELIRSEFAPWLIQAPGRILDLCTGSGCIGISCALAFPDAQVVLLDIDSKAVELAQKNIELHQLSQRVTVQQSDLFEALEPGIFDLIVTNPPYVDTSDFESMPLEYAHEPKHGLYAGTDGLDVVKRILQDAKNWLSPNGILVGEVGNSALALSDQLTSVAFVWPDLQDGGNGVFLLEAGALSTSGISAGAS